MKKLSMVFLLSVLAWSSSNFAFEGIAYYGEAFKDRLSKLRVEVNRDNNRSDWVKELLYEKLKNGQELFSYRTARQYLFGRLHLDQSRGYEIEDSYCERYFTSGVGPMKIPDHRNINCEHTWPQSKFSKLEPKSFQKVDLHHLFPVDSVANSTRGNSPFGEVFGRPIHSKCDSSQFGSDISSGRNSFEPPNSHKGNVARALFYFSVRYRISIDSQQESYLRQWHRQDPVDRFERWRNSEIEEIQGNRNPFIDDETLVSDIEDF